MIFYNLLFNMPVKSNKKNNCVVQIQEKEDVQEKRNHANVKELLHLLDQTRQRRNITDEDVDKVKTILRKNKCLINYQHCKENKIRSILHIIKYDSKLPYGAKQKIINAIIDVGCELYEFSASKSIGDNCHALFFIAANGEYTKLRDVVLHFKSIGDVAKLHDTREGDTVISFMLKFGDHIQKNYLSCMELLLKERIDCNRIDYYKNNIAEVIEKEKLFLQKTARGREHIENLDKIQTFIDEYNNISERDEDIVFARIRKKHELFQSVILKDTNFKNVLKQNMNLIDANDGENTLLQLAIMKNMLDVTRELLLKGADPNRIVEGRNEEFPIVLAAKLNREDIFMEIVQSQHLHITQCVYIKFVTVIKPRYLNYLLESSNIDVNYHYNDKTPLYHAIVRRNRKAIQSLLRRGARLSENCLENINPRDLEEYLNSCIKFDNFNEDMEENDYKSFLVFDFFINSRNSDPNIIGSHQDIIEPESEYDNLFGLTPPHKSFSEIHMIRKIGSMKRLQHLLEHPLIYVFIILKWYCVLYYYYCFVLFKFVFYSIIVLLLYLGSINFVMVTFILIFQFAIVSFNFAEFKYEFRRYTLHFLLEIFIFIFLTVICIFQIIDAHSTVITQLSAFTIILISLSLLLTLGYHISLAKWMSMAKRVFKNFFILLIFFTLPILAFAAAFNLLIPVDDTSEPQVNEDFQTLPKSIFRTLVMLGGDIGDKRFILFGGYIAFLLFAIGMAIILMNFWTGVAVSDIKEIEDQSTVVACKNVIIFIEGVEQMYNLILYGLLKYWLSSRWSHWVRTKLPLPFLQSKVALKKKKKSKHHYGIDLYINNENHFKNNKHFKKINLEHDIIAKIKTLYDDKDFNIPKTLKQLVDATKPIDDIYKRLCVHETYLKELINNFNQRRKSLEKAE